MKNLTTSTEVGVTTSDQLKWASYGFKVEFETIKKKYSGILGWANPIERRDVVRLNTLADTLSTLTSQDFSSDEDRKFAVETHVNSCMLLIQINDYKTHLNTQLIKSEHKKKGNYYQRYF